MRILAAADLHGVKAVSSWLVELAGTTQTDALVLAGDLLAAGFPSEQRKRAESLVRLLEGSPVPVLYIMGNDDNVALGAVGDRVVAIHGRAVECGGYKFVGYQYTPPFVGEEFVKPDEEIAEDLAQLETLVDERTILVTHTPAWGALDECFGENVGSRAVAALLARRPALAHIHGHIHGRFGREGNHFNVACAGTCRAMLIDVPTLQHAVVTSRQPAPKV